MGHQLALRLIASLLLLLTAADGARIGPGASRHVVSRSASRFGARKLSGNDAGVGPAAPTGPMRVVDHRQYVLKKAKKKAEEQKIAAIKRPVVGHDGLPITTKPAHGSKQSKAAGAMPVIFGGGGLPLVQDGNHVSALGGAGKGKGSKKTLFEAPSKDSNPIRRTILDDDKFFVYMAAP